MISVDQHGFLPLRSTTSNLMGYISDISEILDSAGEVHATYTDFQKAFDLVNHNVLIQKLEHMGIHGSLLRWCESYLKNRSQLVSMHGYKSTSRVVPSGVPQGSHLGPLFFVIFINDLVTNLTSSFKLYADDLKIYRPVSTYEDVYMLQKDLVWLLDWCEDNGMTLYVNKCYHIKFSRKIEPLAACYFINDTPLTEVSQIRDLGVIVDRTLSFRYHISHIVNKATKLTGFVSRQMKLFRDPKLSVIVYSCLIRSILEYCSPVWNPCYQVHSARIERVQKRFLYYLAFSDFKCKKLYSYESRLNYYNLSTLQKRRTSADILFLYKLVNAHISCPDMLHRLRFNVFRPSSRLHNRKTFALPLFKTNLGQHSPLYRMCSSYNVMSNKYDIFFGSLASAKISILRNII